MTLRAPAAGLIVAPIVWAVHQQGVYVLVPVSCNARMLIIPFATIAAGIVIAAAAWLSRASVGSVSAETEAVPDAHRRTNRFLAQLSLFGSGLFLLAVVLQGVASLVLGACQR